MYKIITSNGAYFYQELKTAAAIMHVLKQEDVAADMYKLLPELRDLLLWHIEKEADNVQG